MITYRMTKIKINAKEPHVTPITMRMSLPISGYPAVVTSFVCEVTMNAVVVELICDVTLRSTAVVAVILVCDVVASVSNTLHLLAIVLNSL